MLEVTFADEAWQDAVEQTLSQWIGWTLDINGETCTLKEIGVRLPRASRYPGDAALYEFPALRVEWWDDEDGEQRRNGLITYDCVEKIHVY